MVVTLGRPSGSEGPLNESKNRFAEFLAAFGTGHGLKEFLATETLHLAEDFLDRAPIGNGLLEPLILLFGQSHTNGLAFDFTGPGIASAPGSRSPVLHIAFADPADVSQLSAETGVFLLAGGGGEYFLWLHEPESSRPVNR